MTHVGTTLGRYRLLDREADGRRAGIGQADTNRDDRRFAALHGTGTAHGRGIAAVHVCLGDVDLAFEWLETAIAEHASRLVMLRVPPRLDGIRCDPRYAEMVRRVGLDDASVEA